MQVIGTQAYGWSQFAAREGRNWEESLDWALSQAAEAGLNCWEPLLSSPEQLEQIGPRAASYGMSLHSVYMGGVLHDPEIAPSTVQNMAAIARSSARYETKLAVVNPNPIAWGRDSDKSDQQLSYQLEQLLHLAELLKAEGVTLCYHTHDAEMRSAAREFHHMLVGSDPHLVRLCLDAHWIYRGAANSQLALEDIIILYGDRISEIHVRQSKNFVWHEVVEEGDIDYHRVFRAVLARSADPLIVIENALEPGTTHTLSNMEAHHRSIAYLKGVVATVRQRDSESGGV